MSSDAAAPSTIRLEPGSVDELEHALAEALAGDDVPAHVAVVGMPIPGLEPVAEGEDDDGRRVRTYEAPVGRARAAFDEQHQLAIVHPLYDGFLVATVTARADIQDLVVSPVGELGECVTAHHLGGPLRRGQSRPVDLELHPGAIGEPGVRGVIRVTDGTDGEPVAEDLRITLATHPAVECVLAGRIDGPLPPAAFDEQAELLATGRTSARRLARRLESARRASDAAGTLVAVRAEQGDGTSGMQPGLLGRLARLLPGRRRRGSGDAADGDA